MFCVNFTFRQIAEKLFNMIVSFILLIYLVLNSIFMEITLMITLKLVYTFNGNNLTFTLKEST